MLVVDVAGGESEFILCELISLGLVLIFIAAEDNLAWLACFLGTHHHALLNIIQTLTLVAEEVTLWRDVAMIMEGGGCLLLEVFLD